MKLAHARAVAVLSLAWVGAALWLVPLAAQAQALSDEVAGYDWTSLGWGAVLGLLGGLLQLIVALASDRRILLQVLLEAGRNTLVSPIAGAAMYLGIKTLTAMHWLAVDTEARFLLIVAAGWAGVEFFRWAKGLAKKVAGEIGAWLVSRSQAGDGTGGNP
jgi:hypothetical protein